MYFVTSDEDSDLDVPYTYSTSYGSGNKTKNQNDSTILEQGNQDGSETTYPPKEDDVEEEAKDSCTDETVVADIKEGNELSATGFDSRSTSPCSNATGPYSRAISPSSTATGSYSIVRGKRHKALSAIHHQKKLANKCIQEYKAAVINGTDSLQHLLSSGSVSVDQTFRNGWTALMTASSLAKHTTVDYLLSYGADVNLHKDLFTPLMAACSSEVNDEKNDGALVKCVESLLRHGAKVNTSERHGMTALMFACKRGQASVARTLVLGGANVNAVDKQGWTALCWACHGGHGCCVAVLLEAAADGSLLTKQEESPADIARGMKYYQIAEVVETVSLGSPISAPLLATLKGNTLTTRPADTPASFTGSCSDLDMILCKLDLMSLSKTFAKHEIDLAGFLRLSAADLKSYGITNHTVQHRLLTAIAEMHRKAWQPSSVAPLNTKPYISLVDATSMLNNVKKHVTFLEATLAFLRQQLESSPSSHHLHHHTTDHSLSTLIETAEDTNRCLFRLQASTKFLTDHIKKLSNQSSYLPADLLVSKGVDVPWSWSRKVSDGGIVFVCVIAVVWAFKPRLLEDASYKIGSVLLDY